MRFSLASENQDLALKLLEKSEGSTMKARFYFDIISNTRVFSVRNETLKALDYYVKAVTTGELPMHDYNALRLFLEAANRNPELVDFEPIIVKDNHGHRVIIDSYNKPRDTWMIVEFIETVKISWASPPENYKPQRSFPTSFELK